jgi:hemolysin activation/secretion protein
VKGGFLHLAALAAGSAFSVSLVAAPAPSTPAAVAAPTPGQVQSTLPTKTPQAKQAPVPAAKPSASNAQGVAPGGPSFHVNSFSIEGNTVIPSDELQAQIAGYLGKDLTLAQLYDVADVLTRYYRDRGYGLAYVTPPAQKLSAGNVRLQVVEGRVGNIDIEGNSRTRTPVLRARTRGLNSGDVYTDAAAERAVLLMDDLPGVSSRAVLSPGQLFGSSDVLFNVEERGYGGDLSVDDYGRQVVGRWRLNADVSINSLTGGGDQLSAGVTHSESNLLNFGKLGYSFPLGSGTLNAAYNRATYTVSGLPVTGSTENGSLIYQYPSLRTQQESFYWGVGITRNISSTSVLTSDTTNITLLQFTTFLTKQQQDQGYYTFSTSLTSNGKSNDGSKNNAELLRLEGDLTWVRPFAGSWSFITLASLEYSPDVLVDNDKFSLGGPGSVRAFPTADARGDRGAFVSGELQRSFAAGPDHALAWGVFLDSGRVWNKRVGLSPIGDATLTGAGTELQFIPSGGGWNARLQWAWSLGTTRPSDGDRGGHIWLTVGTSY